MYAKNYYARFLIFLMHPIADRLLSLRCFQPAYNFLISSASFYYNRVYPHYFSGEHALTEYLRLHIRK